MNKMPKIELTATNKMPTDKESREILLNRSMRVSQKITIEKKNNRTNFIHFILGNEHYGIPFKYTKEILNYMSITFVPCIIDCIYGVINYRGKLISIIDLKKLFNITGIFEQMPGKIIILSSNNITMGCVADHIIDNDTYDPTSLDTTLSSNSQNNTNFFSGVYNGNITILNIESLFSDLKLKIKAHNGE